MLSADDLCNIFRTNIRWKWWTRRMLTFVDISINGRCLTYIEKNCNTQACRDFWRSVSCSVENGEDLACSKYLCCRLSMFAKSFNLILDENCEKGGCSLTLDISINARLVIYNDKKSKTLVPRVFSGPVSSQNENREDLACPKYLCCRLSMFTRFFTLIPDRNGE